MKSARDKIDYCEYFAETGSRPQNFLQDYDPEERFKDHSKTQELIRLKNALIKSRNHPEVFLKADIRTVDPKDLGTFDVILIDPPWNEYHKRTAMLDVEKTSEKLENWSVEDIRDIKVTQLANDPSFIFLWVGSEHLDNGRYLFKQWGLKRCEDVVWIKSNVQVNKLNSSCADSYSFLKRVKEHCLVGIFGNAKEASEGTFIHANIDTDVILSEEPEIGNFNKPAELYDIIERFCLGRKKLELFANKNSIRPGWLSVGKQLPESNFVKEQYDSWFEGDPRPGSYVGGRILQSTPEIEALRPKSPPKQGANLDPAQSKPRLFD